MGGGKLLEKQLLGSLVTILVSKNTTAENQLITASRVIHNLAFLILLAFLPMSLSRRGGHPQVETQKGWAHRPRI